MAHPVPDVYITCALIFHSQWSSHGYLSGGGSGGGGSKPTNNMAPTPTTSAQHQTKSGHVGLASDPAALPAPIQPARHFLTNRKAALICQIGVFVVVVVVVASVSVVVEKKL